MKHWFVLLTTAAAFTAFAPASSQAQVAVEVPGVGVRIGEPPARRARSGSSSAKCAAARSADRDGARRRAPDGSSRTVTRKKCD